MKKEKLVYVEPADCFPEDTRKEHGLDEYALGKIEYDRIPNELKQLCSKEEWDQMSLYEQRCELSDWEYRRFQNSLFLTPPSPLDPEDE